jgi:hypothetical protein
VFQSPFHRCSRFTQIYSRVHSINSPGHLYNNMYYTSSELSLWEVVLPQLWPMPFEENWYSVRSKMVKITRIFEKLGHLKSPVVTFWSKRIGNLLSRNLISYEWLQNLVIKHNWSNIWTTSGPLFLEQNATLWVWEGSASQIFW